MSALLQRVAPHHIYAVQGIDGERRVKLVDPLQSSRPFKLSIERFAKQFDGLMVVADPKEYRSDFNMRLQKKMCVQLADHCHT